MNLCKVIDFWQILVRRSSEFKNVAFMYIWNELAIGTGVMNMYLSAYPYELGSRISHSIIYLHNYVGTYLCTCMRTRNIGANNLLPSQSIN